MNLNLMESEVLSEKLEDLRTKLGRTISQIQLIDNKVRDFTQRARRAGTNKKNSFRYNLRMKSSIAGGVKIMYRQYLTQKAEEVRAMEQALAAMRQRQYQQLLQEQVNEARAANNEQRPAGGDEAAPPPTPVQNKHNSDAS